MYVPTTYKLDQVTHMLPHMSESITVASCETEKETGIQEPQHVPLNT